MTQKKSDNFQYEYLYIERYIPETKEELERLENIKKKRQLEEDEHQVVVINIFD
jgi:hypothetical protein